MIRRLAQAALVAVALMTGAPPPRRRRPFRTRRSRARPRGSRRSSRRGGAARRRPAPQARSEANPPSPPAIPGARWSMRPPRSPRSRKTGGTGSPIRAPPCRSTGELGRAPERCRSAWRRPPMRPISPRREAGRSCGARRPGGDLRQARGLAAGAQRLSRQPAAERARGGSPHLRGAAREARLPDHELQGRSDSASPRACFQFSEPLATGKVDFAPFVAVSGAANAAITARARSSASTA